MKVNYWDMAPALTSDRMSLIAEILIRVRQDALAIFDPEKGDSSWGFGCVVYDRCRNTIVKAATQHKWLGILDHSLHFVFTVGGVPIRFENGDSEHPKPRHLRRRSKELKAQQLAFEALGPDFPIEGRWRIIYETNDETMAVDEVVLVQVNGESEILNAWPLEIPTDIVPTHLRRNTPAANLPAPDVSLRSVAQGPPAQHA